MARSIAIAGQILGPGQLAEVPEANWSGADEEWVKRGLVSVLTRANGVVVVKSNLPAERVSAPVPPPSASEDEEEKPKRKTRRRAKKSE
tara:strand:- start:13821 stop:14087 length:267 start_codon:yes stop_codon:yes gene_type:complete